MCENVDCTGGGNDQEGRKEDKDEGKRRVSVLCNFLECGHNITVTKRYKTTERGNDVGFFWAFIKLAGRDVASHPTWPERARIAREVASGLQHMHALRIVHRDVKSGNLLVCRDVRAKIADLGLVCVSGTVCRERMGTLAYRDVIQGFWAMEPTRRVGLQTLLNLTLQNSGTSQLRRHSAVAAHVSNV
jgi:hypothetical protein